MVPINNIVCDIVTHLGLECKTNTIFQKQIQHKMTQYVKNINIGINILGNTCEILKCEL